MKKLTLFLSFLGFYAQSQNSTIQDNTSNILILPSGIKSTRTNSSVNSVAIGANTMPSSSGSQHVAIGDGALNANTTAWGSVAIGYNALNKNNFTGGQQNANTAIGHTALANNTTGYVNTAIGARALLQNINGFHNTAIGSLAGEFATGSRNIFIGVQAGQNELGNDKLYIANSDTPNPLIWGDFSSSELKINGKLQTHGNSSGYLQVTNPTTGVSASDGILIGFANGSNLGQVTNQEPNDLILGANNSEKIRIKTTGFVGIGLQDPQSDLHINNSSTTAKFQISNPSSSSTTTDGLQISLENSSNHAKIMNFESGDLVLGSNNSEKLKITGAGNIETNASVGINITPAALHHVHNPSPISSNSLYTNSSSGSTASDGLYVGLGGLIQDAGYIWNYENQPLYFGTNNTGRMTISNDGFVGINTAPNSSDRLLINGNIQAVGNIRVIGGNFICSSGSVLCSSDFRFKKDFQKIDFALDKILKINGLYYFWRKDEFKEKAFTDEKQIGVIAQEVEKFFPELVKTDSEGFKSVDYARLTPILIEAMKELNQKVEKLENEKNDFKTRLEKIEAMILIRN